MKKAIIILLIIITYTSFTNDAKDMFEKSVSTAMKINYTAVKVYDRIKFLDADDIVSDTLYVMMKRNGFIPKINALFRIQYANGNVILFTGREYKSLDVDEKKLFVIDTSQGAFYWFETEGISQLAQKLIPSKSNNLLFSKGYKYEFLDDVELDGTTCRQISISSRLRVPEAKEKGYDTEVYPVYDSAVVAVSLSDNLIRRFYRYVVLEDGKSQIEEQYFTNYTVGLPIDNLMFDISLPQGYTLETYDADAEQPDLIKKGSPAPKWVLADEKGKEFRLSESLGDVVVLDFWGTWCKWCVKAMPKIQKLHEQYSDKGVKFFGISCQEPHNADPKKFMDAKGITYQLLVQGDEVAKHYKVKGFPTLYIVDKKGNVAYSFVGYADDLFERISKVIEKEILK